MGDNDYQIDLEGLPSLVSLGAATIRIARADDRDRLQTGFSRDGSGMTLVSGKPGDWQEGWLVIGEDETCGDPIFISTIEEGFPVYTAMIGMGEWKPTRIASSINGFERALAALLRIAKGRENPLALKANPITARERGATLAEIGRQNPSADLEFWASLIDAA